MRREKNRILFRRRGRLHILEIYVGGLIINHLQWGQGNDVIFLHGWGGSTASFLGVAKRIASFCRVTVVDFYGFGDTPHPNYPLYLDDYAEGVIDIIKHYRMNKVILVGHSFGGRVAIRIASSKGYLLEKIVLIDSAGVLPRRGIKYYYKIYRHKLLNKLHIPHKAGSNDYRILTGAMQQTFKNIINEDQSGELDKVTLPVLLIWGSKDKDTPIYMARRMNRKMPDSALIIFIGAGHYSYIERFGTFLSILTNFLSGGDNELDNSLITDNSRRSGVVKIPMY